MAPRQGRSPQPVGTKDRGLRGARNPTQAALSGPQDLQLHHNRGLALSYPLVCPIALKCVCV